MASIGLFLNCCLGLAVLGQLLGNAAAQCRHEEIQSCPHIDLLKGGFKGFIPVEHLEEQCRVLRIALDCALQPKYVDNCDERKLISYKAHDKVIKSICDDYRYAYEKSGTCFSAIKVQNEVKYCIEDAQDSDDPCIAFEEAPDCARDYISTQQGCSEQDANLMAVLVGANVGQLAPVIGCSWVDVDTKGIATAPTTVKTTSSTTTTSTTTTSTVSTPNEATGTSRESHTEPERLGRAKQQENGTPQLNTALSCLVLSLLFLFYAKCLTSSC